VAALASCYDDVFRCHLSRIVHPSLSSDGTWHYRWLFPSSSVVAAAGEDGTTGTLDFSPGLFIPAVTRRPDHQSYRRWTRGVSWKTASGAGVQTCVTEVTLTVMACRHPTAAMVRVVVIQAQCYNGTARNPSSRWYTSATSNNVWTVFFLLLSFEHTTEYIYYVTPSIVCVKTLVCLTEHRKFLWWSKDWQWRVCSDLQGIRNSHLPAWFISSGLNHVTVWLPVIQIWALSHMGNASMRPCY
jgi:hypothetical protein